MPRLLAGPPDESCSFVVQDAGDVKIFYPARLTAKPFQEQIRIRLKTFLFLKWLEMEGARSIVSDPAGEK